MHLLSYLRILLLPPINSLVDHFINLIMQSLSLYFMTHHYSFILIIIIKR